LAGGSCHERTRQVDVAGDARVLAAKRLVQSRELRIWGRQLGEDTMKRRSSRDMRPDLEAVECRDLLSAITDVMAGNSIAAEMRLLAAGANASSNQSIALPQNQGPLLNPDGSINNPALAPTGTLTKRELKKEQFKARYVGTYTVGAGRTSDERIQTFITGAGVANTMLHTDIQMLLVTPNDPNSDIGGVSTIFDRNINSNTSLGFNIAGLQSQQPLSGLELPSFLNKVSVDVNISSGTYTEAYSVGTIKIRYIPSGKHTPGVLSQGKAIVTINAQIYSANTSFILRNTHINP
jgi:hypothetical protein